MIELLRSTFYCRPTVTAEVLDDAALVELIGGIQKSCQAMGIDA